MFYGNIIQKLLYQLCCQRYTSMYVCISFRAVALYQRFSGHIFTLQGTLEHAVVNEFIYFLEELCMLAYISIFHAEF